MSCHCQSAFENSRASADLPGMIATLDSYDQIFGPCHIQTLSVAARLAEALWTLGDKRSARRLLERVIRDLAHSAGRTRIGRLPALNRLRDLLVREAEFREEVIVLTEISKCWLLLGEAGAAKSDLESLIDIEFENANRELIALSRGAVQAMFDVAV
jgi:hypothetical protein